MFLIEAFAVPLRASRRNSFAGHQARGGHVDDVIEQHEKILDAIKARNPKQAAQAMREHLQQTEQDLRTLMQNANDQLEAAGA